MKVIVIVIVIVGWLNHGGFRITYHFPLVIVRWFDQTKLLLGEHVTHIKCWQSLRSSLIAFKYDQTIYLLGKPKKHHLPVRSISLATTKARTTRWLHWRALTRFLQGPVNCQKWSIPQNGNFNGQKVIQPSQSAMNGSYWNVPKIQILWPSYPNLNRLTIKTSPDKRLNSGYSSTNRCISWKRLKTEGKE